MKRLFGRHSRANSSHGTSNPSSSSSSVTSSHVKPVVDRRFSAPTYATELLHSNSSSSAPSSGSSSSSRYSSGESAVIDDDDSISPQTSMDNESVALSETDTLYYDKRHRLELQETYNDNFTLYLPFIIRQMRIESQRLNTAIHQSLHTEYDTTDSTTRSSTPHESDNSAQNRYHTNPLYDLDDLDDDLPTIIDESITVDPSVANNLILNKSTSKFNLKRDVIVVTEFMKNNTYVFTSNASFELFKSLRSNIKKDRKNSVIVYDKGGSIRRLSNVKREDFNTNDRTSISANKEYIIDDRQHIVPLNYKVKGLGLPLFKIQVPYMSTFKKNAPFMIFKKYREIPTQPLKQDYENGRSSSSSKHADKEKDESDNYESYNFCTIYSKFFQRVRRFIFHFKYINKHNQVEEFKVIMFLNNYKPYADFNYRNTRFRIIGPAIPSGYIMNYNPHLRLLIIDDDKPSLCDNLINKKPGFEISKMIKRSSSNGSTNEDSVDTNDIVVIGSTTYTNAYPNPNSALMQDSPFLNTGVEQKHSYISDKLPPFGAFKDALLYLREPSNILPKKYSEAGKIQVYQDNSAIRDHDNLDSTLSFDVDSMVLTCVLCTLREVSIRNSNKAPNSNLGVVGRFGAFPVQSPGVTAFGFAAGL
ncbi:hypothetical protein DFJ63DRAFT_310106 [Scheffersomyces coipomensis]|uniref:uncharacterized protein n=1 Tax=Scheffersomyces coipomensis TaxID=1788519 RepID=UPI00315CE270